MKKKINKQTVEEVLRWVEWKGIDIQYDLFDEKKFVDDSRFAKYITNNSQAYPLNLVQGVICILFNTNHKSVTMKKTVLILITVFFSGLIFSQENKALESQIVKQWMDYSKGFEYKDY